MFLKGASSQGHCIPLLKYNRPLFDLRKNFMIEIVFRMSYDCVVITGGNLYMYTHG